MSALWAGLDCTNSIGCLVVLYISNPDSTDSIGWLKALCVDLDCTNNID